MTTQVTAPILASKPWYQSKLVWLGVVMTLAGAVPVALALVAKSPITPADIVAAVGGVLTVILRVWFTDQPIS
jgi:hypothetical protein